MNKNNNRLIKYIVTILDIINIIEIVIIEYGLPSLAQRVSGESNSVHSDSDMGTIEEVQKEEATKEEQAAQTALAREEVEKETEPEEEIDPDAPILELTDDHIYLKVGDRFNYMSYIKTMEDVDGSDLSHYIYLDGDVDTSEPGEIELTYRITSTITGKSTSKVLLITIEE